MREVHSLTGGFVYTEGRKEKLITVTFKLCQLLKDFIMRMGFKNHFI